MPTPPDLPAAWTAQLRPVGSKPRGVRPTRLALAVVAPLLVAMLASACCTTGRGRPPRTDGLLECVGGREQVPHIYDSTTLFDFMDGEADLFLEYHFESLMVVEAGSLGGGSGAIEIYSMASSNDAFGIFSVRSLDAERSYAVGTESADRGSCLEFCRGRYFVKVLCDSLDRRLRLAQPVDQCIREDGAGPQGGPAGGPRDSLAGNSLAKHLAPKDFLIGAAPDGLIPHSVATAEGPLGLRMLPYPVDGFPEMLGAWQRIVTYRADEPPSGLFEVYEIQYATPEAAALGFNTIKARIRERGPNEAREEGQTLYVSEGGKPRHTIHQAGDLITWSAWPR